MCNHYWTKKLWGKIYLFECQKCHAKDTVTVEDYNLAHGIITAVSQAIKKQERNNLWDSFWNPDCDLFRL